MTHRPAGNSQVRKSVIKLLNQVDSTSRINIVYDLFTSNLTADKIGKPGLKALRFKDLKIGDTFIDMPTPGDDHGHGGLKNSKNIFRKIEATPDEVYFYGERDNARSLVNGALSTMSPGMHVVRVFLEERELMPTA
ncbi:MAG: hypothetical protein Q7R84_02040 [bacterium]|nr:hypothetical protein [bacterium]